MVLCKDSFFCLLLSGCACSCQERAGKFCLAAGNWAEKYAAGSAWQVFGRYLRGYIKKRKKEWS